ncbi:dicarboxylate/amino acid:cation symporter [Solitalea lacus]|uniref:dicarboxylate/amino acid:cation symporter n=1 Tax=Solitalea lacus TaxID=2911172 RepID=UPI001EDB3BC3|nr:dicarboxylate/amino acid:cation symporter [Solitalea lacus]UKJ07815.1 dicarboxylate/amino acid:cation symporter [Solitalea lacus]
MTSSLKMLYKNYSSIILLLGGIIIGSLAGLFFGKEIAIIKPIGDIFLNLLFTSIIPLIFFAISSSVANIEQMGSFGKVMRSMLFVFLFTTLLSAFLMIIAVTFFPITDQFQLSLPKESDTRVAGFGEQLTALFTTTDFSQLLTRQSMLALIIFSILVGTATLKAGKSGELFKQFLNSGNEVFKWLIGLIMKAAPLGLGAYFGYLVGVFGPELFGSYAHSLGLYYGFGIVYFFVMFSVYAFMAGGLKTIPIYWKNNIVPSLTALGTCSSVATIPVNMQAAEKMGVSKPISDITIPLGASLHKDGSSIGGVIKVAMVFAIFNKSWAGLDTMLIILGIALMTSIVEGGIPNGGYVGELFIVTAFHLPIEALSVLMVISTLIDPMATLLNATGDTVASMMIARLSEGKNWMNKQIQAT